MFSFQEIGAIIRLIFIYKLNVKLMNQAHKDQEKKESDRDVKAGIIFISTVILVGFIIFFIS